MIGVRPRRSIVFQVWIRLSAIMVSFTLLALGAYVWLEINDSIDEARQQAVARANAISTAAARIGTSGSDPSPSELAVAESLGVAGVQFLAPDGSVTSAFGDLTGDSVRQAASVQDGGLAFDAGSPVRLTSEDFARTRIDALDLLRGGTYGSVHVYPFPASTTLGGMRIVIAYDDLAGHAQTLLLRSLALTGAILVVAVLAMWGLLNRFVARPLRLYSTVAYRIAAGETLRMPDLDTNELGQLGRAINGMADILRHQATLDPLTGLYNLRHLTTRLESLLEDSRDHNQPLALLVCDLDNLKPVNDTYGHHTGDRLLKEVARHLTAWSTMEYTCWRTGGDEFAAVIPGGTFEEAVEAAADLQRALATLRIPAPGGADIAVSVSIGIANFPVDGLTGAALMQVADMRMYEAKARRQRPVAATKAA